MKIYKLEKLEEVNNQNIETTYPSIYPSHKYFSNIEEVLKSYGLILVGLSTSNYNIESYLENITNDIYVSSFFVEREFKILQSKETNDFIYESETILNYNSKKVAEIHYLDNKSFVKDEFENIELEVLMHIQIDDINIYLNGSTCYIEDAINKKSYCVYLD